VRVFYLFLFLLLYAFYYRLKINVLLFFYIFDIRLLSVLIQVNVFSFYTISDQSVVVAVILLFIHCLWHVIPATKLLNLLSHFR
jgi:hypothetical protein